MRWRPEPTEEYPYVWKKDSSGSVFKPWMLARRYSGRENVQQHKRRGRAKYVSPSFSLSDLICLRKSCQEQWHTVDPGAPVANLKPLRSFSVSTYRFATRYREELELARKYLVSEIAASLHSRRIEMLGLALQQVESDLDELA
jgi:hypothetical protein